VEIAVERGGGREERAKDLAKEDRKKVIEN